MPGLPQEFQGAFAISDSGERMVRLFECIRALAASNDFGKINAALDALEPSDLGESQTLALLRYTRPCREQLGRRKAFRRRALKEGYC